MTTPMNYNPFDKAYISTPLRRHPRPKNLFDRIVGRPSQMAVLDYLLVVPFIVKSLYNVSRGRSIILTAFFGALTIPFSIAKFAIYVALSPVTFIGWAIGKLISRQIGKYAKSPFTRALNKLTVTPAAKPGEDEDGVAAKPLASFNKLHDINLRQYSIKVNNFNELVLFRSPSGLLVGTIEKTRQNITVLQDLVGSERGAEDGVQYALDNMGKTVFKHQDIDRVRTWLNQVTAEQAVSHIQLLKRVLFVGDRASGTDIGRDEHANKDEITFADIPRDVRSLIFDLTLKVEAQDQPAPGARKTQGMFRSYTHAETQAALSQYAVRELFRKK